MRRVFIASPYAGDTVKNAEYLKACLRDSLGCGEAPFAPHGLYPSVLDDTNLEDRKQAMEAGQCWLESAYILAVYSDLGVSEGMQKEIDRVFGTNVITEFRSLPGWGK